MTILTKQLDAALDKLQQVQDAAADADMDAQAEKIGEFIESLREINFNEENPEFDEEGALED
jgi:hypothetical protein